MLDIDWQHTANDQEVHLAVLAVNHSISNMCWRYHSLPLSQCFVLRILAKDNTFSIVVNGGIKFGSFSIKIDLRNEKKKGANQELGHYAHI